MGYAQHWTMFMVIMPQAALIHLGEKMRPEEFISNEKLNMSPPREAETDHFLGARSYLGLSGAGLS